jgi:hypothetical protein
VRATVTAERAGVRGVCLITSGFVEQARAIARALGTPGLSIVEYPGVVMTQSQDEIGQTVSDFVVERVADELGGRSPDS